MTGCSLPQCEENLRKSLVETGVGIQSGTAVAYLLWYRCVGHVLSISEPLRYALGVGDAEASGASRIHRELMV